MISVIIPTLNEQENLRHVLEVLLREQDIKYEIIIVDGGSKDNTIKIAKSFPVRCLESSLGRGQQLCTGLRQARGDIIFFLHADSTLSGYPLQAIQKELDNNIQCIGGNFALLFDGSDDFSLWLNDFYKWLRSRGVYYGDSGIFIRKPVLDKIGGLRDISLMEDYDLVKRMEKFGPTCNIQNPVLITSSRRFHGRGKWSIIWGWVKIHMLYYLGCSGDYLAQLYDSSRKNEKANHTHT